MLNVVLWEPEIPPNTGNVARLCVANDVALHLIGPLGFQINDRQLRRAGLDYWQHVNLTCYDDWSHFQAVQSQCNPYCYSAHAVRRFTEVQYCGDDWLLFGSETRGLPASIISEHKDRVLTVPMLTTRARSLNLATTVGIVLYEALRQIHEW